jgi:uroporphyrinogen-III synthase
VVWHEVVSVERDLFEERPSRTDEVQSHSSVIHISQMTAENCCRRKFPDFVQTITEAVTVSL